MLPGKVACLFQLAHMLSRILCPNSYQFSSSDISTEAFALACLNLTVCVFCGVDREFFVWFQGMVLSVVA